MLFGENADRPGDGSGGRSLNIYVSIRFNNSDSNGIHDLRSACEGRYRPCGHPSQRLQILGGEDRWQRI
jgi:hypothetical protein